jgi:hypothetical protein
LIQQFFKNAGEVQGEQPTFAKQTKLCNLASLLQLHFLKLSNSKLAALRETNRIRFGRNASLSAFVLFAGGCVVRIVFESFLDFCFSEFFMFSRWRTAVSHISLRSQFHLINTSVKEGSLTAFACGSHFAAHLKNKLVRLLD